MYSLIITKQTILAQLYKMSGPYSSPYDNPYSFSSYPWRYPYRHYHLTQSVMDGHQQTQLAPIRSVSEPRGLPDIRDVNFGYHINTTWPANENSLRCRWEARNLWWI